MNKNTRNALIFSIIVIVGLVIFGIIYYISSHRTVTFDIIPEDAGTITIYNQNNQQAGTLQQDGSLRLQPGTYTFTSSEERYAGSVTEFVVNDDTTIRVDPAYSEAYRNELLRAENTAILDTITSTYAAVINGFTINTGTIYHKGDWYATTLTQRDLPGGQQGDIYRVVLQKVEGTWQIAATPAIVISTRDYPNIPYDILKDINAR